MEKRHELKWLAGVAALMFTASTQAAVVDLFTTDQAKLIDSTTGDGGLTSSVSSGGGDILGGERDLFVELLTVNGANPTATADISVAGGALSFSVDSLATGTGTVQWDGADSSIALDTTGLGGVDLTTNGNAFAVETLFSDLGFEFVVGAYTNATQWTVISFSAHAVNSPTTSYIPFSGFTTPFLCGTVNPAPGVNSVTCGAGGTVDLSNLGALEFKIDPSGGTTSVDLTLDQITTVPEPTTLALLGLGLSAFSLAGRRRKRGAQ